MTARFPFLQYSFQTGEIGESAAERADTQFYKTAATFIENGICLQQGGITRRGGMRYLATLSEDDIGDDLRLFPLFFSDTKLFVGAVGQNQVQVFDKNGARVFGVGAPISARQASFAFADGKALIAYGDGIPYQVRQGDDGRWHLEYLNYTGTPQQTFGSDTIDENREEIWSADFSAVASGSEVIFTLGNASSASVRIDKQSITKTRTIVKNDSQRWNDRCGGKSGPQIASASLTYDVVVDVEEVLTNSTIQRIKTAIENLWTHGSTVKIPTESLVGERTTTPRL